MMSTEWRSILGDKYCHALPFDVVQTERLEEASVIAWDGVISVKGRRLLEQVASELKRGKVLLRMGEAETLFKNHPFIKIFNSPEIATIQLSGWSVLPEEILAALEVCYQKTTTNV